MKRLFIESDVLQEDELSSSQCSVALYLESQNIPYNEKDVFDEVVEYAWHEADKAWDAVKRADEIYASSGLVPLCGYGSYTGAPVVMDVMMKKAIEEKITGKSLIFLRDYKDVDWEQIDIKLMPKAFANNKLFTMEYDNGYKLKPVDIEKLVKSYKK